MSNNIQGKKIDSTKQNINTASDLMLNFRRKLIVYISDSSIYNREKEKFPKVRTPSAVEGDSPSCSGRVLGPDAREEWLILGRRVCSIEIVILQSR